jgi:hypothetical protein
MSVVNILLHATVSEDASFGTLDVTDFYLGNDMPSPEFLIIHTSLFSPAVLTRLGITPFIQKDKQGKPFFYARCDKTIPGFKQAGFHANQQVTALLLAHGYYQLQPCLFTHTIDPIYFALVVDDYGIKYRDIAHFHRLVNALSTKYHVKAHPIADTFLGQTIVHDRIARTITTSMPTYVPNMLQRYRPDGVKHAASPSIYVPPIYGSTAPQLPTTDSSAPASPAEAAELQKIVGSALYYARANDITALEAVTTLSSLQSKPTASVLASQERLLGYLAKFPNHCRVIRPSSMLLQIHSDASYLSLPNSGSKAGGFHTLGDHTPHFINSSIDCISTRIPVKVASAAEAELASVYANAQLAVPERLTLKNIGYPQPPTPIFCDNECAIGLSTQTVIPKKSKSMDQRFNWIRERVSLLEFTIPFVKSLDNWADFFTKPLPVWRHSEMVPLFVCNKS